MHSLRAQDQADSATLKMHFGFTGIAPLLLYIAMFVVFLVAIFWKPEVGLYFIIPLLPMQTQRYRIIDLPLGAQLIDVILFSVIVGLVCRGETIFPKTPMTRFLGAFFVYSYASLCRGSFFLGRDLPYAPSDPRMADWKNYVVMFLIFFLVVASIKDRRQMMILLALMLGSVLLVDKGFYGNMSGRNTAEYSHDLRDGGMLGYAGANGLAAFESQVVAMLAAMTAYAENRRLKLLLLFSTAFSTYCVLFAYSRGGYLALVAICLFIGIMKQRSLLIALVLMLVSWQVVLPVSVQQRMLMTYDDNQGGLEGSSADRLTIWEDALQVFDGDPLSGTGWNTYAYMGRVKTYTDTHNLYIKVLVETGLSGLFLFLWLLGKMLRMGWRLYREATNSFFEGLGLGFVAWMMCVLIVNMFGDRWAYPQITGFTVALLGCVVRARMIIEADRATQQEVAAQGLPVEVVPA